MEKRIINSQLSNFQTYSMYFRQMLALAENVFEFEGLPEFIDLSYLNKVLLRQGSIVFFKDEDLGGVVALPWTLIGKKDVYDRPLEITVKGENGYQRTLKQGEFVLMYDNNSRYPLYLDIAQFAQRIANCVRTCDINVWHQKTPRIWKTSKDKELSLKRMLNNVDSNIESIVTYDSIDINDMDTVLAPAPYVTDKIDNHLDKIWAEFFRLIGVANIQETKKERLITDELTASQGGTIASRYNRFEPRKRAIDEINKKWPELHMSVRYYDGEPSTDEDDKDDKELKDERGNDVSTDTVLQSNGS